MQGKGSLFASLYMLCKQGMKGKLDVSGFMHHLIYFYQKYPSVCVRTRGAS